MASRTHKLPNPPNDNPSCHKLRIYSLFNRCSSFFNPYKHNLHGHNLIDDNRSLNIHCLFQGLRLKLKIIIKNLNYFPIPCSIIRGPDFRCDMECMEGDLAIERFMEIL